jgi:small subunit ribosomal protein S23
MVRRVATQVHRQVTRLLKTNYIRKEPTWYQAVLEHPPIPLPPRAPASRSPDDQDLPTNSQSRIAHLKKPEKVKALPVVYLEDEIRRQFFRDHPFEAFRERTMVEGLTVQDEHPIKGTAWTRLGQRTKNPSPEEYVHSL